VTVTLMAMVARGANAAPSTEAERQARRAFQSAEAYFHDGRFAEALAEYQAGYEQAPLPGFLINIAQCHRRLGDLVKARATYQKFVLVAPDSPHIPEVKSLIAELDQLLADLAGGNGASASSSKAAGGVASPSSLASTASAPPASAVSPPAVPLLSAAPPPSDSADRALLGTPAQGAASSVPASPERSSHLWWWGLAGLAVAGGAVAAYALSSSPTSTIHEGSLGTLRR